MGLNLIKEGIIRNFLQYSSISHGNCPLYNVSFIAGVANIKVQSIEKDTIICNCLRSHNPNQAISYPDLTFLCHL